MKIIPTILVTLFVLWIGVYHGNVVRYEPYIPDYWALYTWSGSGLESSQYRAADAWRFKHEREWEKDALSPYDN